MGHCGKVQHFPEKLVVGTYVLVSEFDNLKNILSSN